MSSNQYGPIMKTGEAIEKSMEIYAISRKEKSEGRKGFPITAWGEAGIGKTELPNYLVYAFADFFGGETKAVMEKGKEVGREVIRSGNIVYLPMAQIEEKAELQGLPDLQQIKTKITKKDYLAGNYTGIGEEVVTMNGDKEVTHYYSVDNRTIYATPSWIPQVNTHGEKGLLVIDDMNRADGRIINSIMQLLQDGRLLGWSLPEGWEIYCTCNPDDGKYDVTGFDGAQMTRMFNFQQVWDKATWTKDWALKTGIHPIAINFANVYPEMMVKGERTNPRSFDKFFRIIAPLLDKVKIVGDSMSLDGDSEGCKLAKQIQRYGLMNIEEESLSSFISFLTSGYGKLPDVEEILSPSFKLKDFYAMITEGGQIRVDIVATLCMRIVFFLEDPLSEVTKEMVEGVKVWIKNDQLPGDLKWTVAHNLTKTHPAAMDKELSKIIMSSFVKKKR